MFTRNQLVHAVIWPNADDACLTLVDADGVVQSRVAVHDPVKGSELSRMIPEGFELDVSGCAVVSMSGDILVRTVAQFDTAVVTERAEVTFEERLQRMERRDLRRQQMHDHEIERLRQVQARLAAEQIVDGPDQAPDGDQRAQSDPDVPDQEAQGDDADGS